MQEIIVDRVSTNIKKIQELSKDYLTSREIRPNIKKKIK